jgi:hypothetical protein
LGVTAVSSRQAQKRRELFILKHFLKGEQIETEVSLREAPDFEITYEGHRVGIEITELFHTTTPGQLPLQATASISNEIVQRAQRLHANAGGPSLRVSVGYSSRMGLGAVRKDEASQLLVEIVHATLEKQGNPVEWRPTYRQDVRAAEIFSHVHIYRHPDGIAPHWLVAAAGWVAPLEPDLIQSSIDQKAKLIESYLGSVPEVWLLIGALGRDPSQFFDLDTSKLGVEMKSPFHRTYFLDSFRPSAIRLHTSP